MILRKQLIFALLLTVAWADRAWMRSGTLLRARANTQPKMPTWSPRRVRPRPFWSEDGGTKPTSTTTEEIPTASDSLDSPEEGSPSSFFTTDPLTSRILIMPTNESISKVMFWPPSEDVSVTLHVFLQNKSNFTMSLETILADNWHIIDLYHQTSYRNHSQLMLYTENKNLKLDKVIQIQVTSNKTTYWCYCPRGNICSLLSPLHYVSGSSKATTDLLVPLLVVVILLIVSLSALAVVIFYKRSELFHIYAKPIDCITHAVPPPLPTPNPCPSPRQSNIENKQHKTERTKENNEQRNDEKVNKNSLIIPGYNKLIQDKVKETENSLYGLV